MKNIGAIVRAERLIEADDNFEKELYDTVEEFVNNIGYKKRIGESDGFNQEDAWNIEINFVKNALREAKLDKDTFVLFEYMLPNENTIRPDIIVLQKNKVSVFELKTRGKTVKPGYVTQFIDYGKIISDYHEESSKMNMEVESFLVMCDLNSDEIIIPNEVKDWISEDDKKRIIGKDGFISVLKGIKDLEPLTLYEVKKWVNSKRSPGRSVMKRAGEIKKELAKGPEGYYSKISGIPIEDICNPVDAVFKLSKEKKKKIIFVSGVPGAGKTLVGMILLFGILGEKDEYGNARKARYFTGNGALKNVLARTLDSPSDIASLFGFRDDHVFKGEECTDEVLIFDEAQRFWSAEKIKFEMEKILNEKEENLEDHKKKQKEALIKYNKEYESDAKSILNAKYTKDNVTLVCLIGDGQKPMNGEAGIEAWVEALRDNSEWDVYIPSNRKDEFNGVECNTDYDLHLSVSQRAHFVDISPWVEAVLRGDLDTAKTEVSKFKEDNNKFNIKIIRSLGRLFDDGVDGDYLTRYKTNKETERGGQTFLYGVLCSSNKYYRQSGSYIVTSIKKLSDGILYEKTWDKDKEKFVGDSNLYIDNNKAYDWYSGRCCDRPCFAATETFCQGLDIDLPIVFFRGDYLMEKKETGEYKWQVNISDNSKSLLGEQYKERVEDTYRILLTRATEEMILVVPDKPEFNDLYNFMIESGIIELDTTEGMNTSSGIDDVH